MPRAQQSSRRGPGYSLAEFLNDNWGTRVSITHEELAARMGYTSPNVASLWKTGKSRVPLERLPALADLLKVDLAALLPLWMEQYAPDTSRRGVTNATYEAIKGVFDRMPNKAEVPALAALRAGMRGRTAPFSKDELEAITRLVRDPDLAVVVNKEARRRDAIKRAAGSSG